MIGDNPTTTAINYPSREVAELPNELHQEIVAHMDPKRDRRTLLNLALCSHSFRTESQRLLFMNTALVHDFHKYDRGPLPVRVHTKFLRAIIKSQERLALYVQWYIQHSVALESTCKRVGGESGMKILVIYKLNLP